MAFQKVVAPPSLRHSPITTRFRPHRGKTGAHVELSKGAIDSIGHPSAVHFEWDPDEHLLRIVASSPDDPAAYALTKAGRVSIAPILAVLPVEISEPVGPPTRADGPLALIADLSEYRSAA